MKENVSYFFDRESEQEELTSILCARPSLIYFIYGPINSGKTFLLVKVLKSLPSDIVPFYINLRGRDVSSTGEFLNVLFDVNEDETAKTERAFMSDVISTGLKMLERFSGIPIPGETFRRLFSDKDKGKDAFKYLEEFFAKMADTGLKPILVVDELQMIKEIANAAGRPLLDKLFNFMVRMTKETHLCHCIASTSDSLFVESIQGNARLEGRTRCLLVDDLEKEQAFDVYHKFVFKDSELVWDNIGGKIGDMVRLEVELRLGLTEMDGLKRLLLEQIGRLDRLLRSFDYIVPEVTLKGYRIKVDPEKIKETLQIVGDKGGLPVCELDELSVRYLVEENVLFFDPVSAMVRPQGRLTKKAIQELKARS